MTGARAGSPTIGFQLLASDAAIARWIEPAAPLIRDAFPRPAMETTAELLRWHLTKVRFGAVRPLVVIATIDDRLIGFAGATPRPLTCAGHAAIGYVVSFVSVAATERGRGVAARLYDRLLQAMPAEAGRVLTFAVDGSGGMAALERAYPRNGFTGRCLGSLPPYAVLRQRVRSEAAAAVAADEPVLALAYHEEFAQHLDLDPRGAVRVDGAGSRVIAAWRLTSERREPLLLLEGLPSPLDGEHLRGAIVAGFAAFPDHAKLLVIPSYPVAAGAVAQAVGLRRLAGPTYRAWIWSRNAADPFLLAGSTSHPVL